MSIGQKYILPFILGFIGMFLCHLGLFLFYQGGIKFTAYIIVYPIVYPLLTIILSIINSRHWFSNAIYLCAFPFLYWYILLLTDGRLNIKDFNLYESTGMSMIMLLTVGISVVSGFITFKLKTYFTRAA